MLADGRSTKQVIVVRRDLGMRRGKEIAQGAHASMGFIVSRLVWADTWGTATANFTPAEHDWLEGGRAKVCLQVPGLRELLEVKLEALKADLTAHLVRDAGRTEIPAGTITALAIGPDWSDLIDPVTGGLELY